MIQGSADFLCFTRTEKDAGSRIYIFADTKHVPYGEKTREQIKGYVEEVLNFLIAKEVDAIVIACNTATSVATKEFRGELPYRSSVWNRQSSARSSSIRICRNGFW